MNKILLSKYLKNKSTEIQWIGEIPEHWNIYKIKHIKRDIRYSIVDGPFGTQLHSDEYLEKGVPVARVTNLTYRGEFCSDNLVYISEKKYQTLKRSAIVSNDVIIAKTGATIGKVGLPNNIDKAIVSSSCLKLSIRHDTNPYFVKYLLISDSGQSQILSEAAGSTRDTINIEPFSNLFFPFPIKNEQDIIVDFLDKKIAQIDKLIKKDQKLIELLQEKRTALINHVVTKGLNPSARMKDSGIEWIGKIPEDWRIHRLKYATLINQNKLNESTSPDFKINYLDISNVNSHGEILNIEKMFFEDAPSRARRITKKGDTIVSTVRTYLKAICYLEKIQKNLIVSTGFAVLNPNKNINSKYLFYFISSEYFVQYIILLSKGVAYPAINPSDLGDIFILQPKIEEQKKIINYLDKQTSKIDKTIKKIQQKINLLEEYKKSLIHHVVTGKVDVRSVKV